MGLNHVQCINLLLSEASLSKLEKFQNSLALPNIKCDCAILFWSQWYWLYIYASKYIFHKKILILKLEEKLLIDLQEETTEVPAGCTCQNLDYINYDD